MIMKRLRNVLSVFIAVVMCVSFTACGGSGYDGASSATYNKSAAPAAAANDSWGGDYGYYDEEAAYDSDYDNGSGSSGNQYDDKQDQFNDTSRKLIKTYNLNVETEDFDPFMAAIQAKINELGGYVENLDTYNGSAYGYRRELHYSNMTVRIPAAKASEFMELIGEKGNITNQSQSVVDVTLDYVDTESRKNSYKAEEQRLLELLDRAETLEEIIILEDKLTDVRYRIESMESQLRSYDNKVDYSTIYLYIQEVEVYTEPEVIPETYGQRLAKSFTESVKNVFEGLKDFLVGFVGAVPGLVIFAIVCFIIFLIARAIYKACKKNEMKKAVARQAAYQAQMEAAQKAQQAAIVAEQAAIVADQAAPETAKQAEGGVQAQNNE